MNLSQILPRPLEKQQPGQIPDICTLLLSLVMTAHLDRAIARKLGWRGVKPNGETALTCRVAGSANIFGINFAEERFIQPNLLEAHFNIHIFPPAESPLLDNFPLAALNLALSPQYPDWIRNFEHHAKMLEPFIAGSLILSAPLSGDALSLQIDSWARLKTISPQGVAADPDWLIKPGEADADYPAFHLLLPLFSTLSFTAADIFNTPPEISFSTTMSPGLSISDGRLVPDLNGHLYKTVIESRFLSDNSAPFSSSTTQKLLKPGILQRYLPAAPQGERPLLHIVTGFLGAGKTTFLKQWLEFLHGRERYTGVIQNEFGPVDLDTALLAGDTIVEALDDGCVCCSLADSLRPGLARILGEMPAHQFILETTGVANPANIKAELKNLADLVTPGLVICVVDASDLVANGIPKSGICADQLQYADVIALNKLDLLEGSLSEKKALQKLSAEISKINPGAIILAANQGAIPFAMLDNIKASSTAARFIEKGVFLTHLDDGYEKMGLTLTIPLKLSDVEKMLAACGGKVSRAKGIIETEEGTAIIQYAGGQLEIIKAPDMDPTGLSIIGKNLVFPDGFPCKIREGKY